MELDIAMKQTQKLALTPQMEQSLWILQMSAQELEQCIEDEILSNPMLDYEETQPEQKEPEASQQDILATEEPERHYSSRRDFSQGDYQAYINALADKKSAGTSLKDHLRLQLHTKHISTRRQQIADYLIECLEESGYLKMTDQEIAQALGLTEQEAEEEIRFLQGLEPWGVFARDLRECLLLQIKHQKETSGELYELADHYIEEIVHNKIPKICKATGWSREKVMDLTTRIKELEPIPGRGYGNEEQGEFIYPDITVRGIGEEFRVVLNKERFPSPRINPEYLPLLTQEAAGNDYQYMQEQYQNAKMLLKNISRRDETLRSVAEAIVERQKDFFAKGKLYLRPMNLSDIAQDIDMHESTVSRALKDKYLECRWGTFELKYFFSNKGAEKNPRSCIEQIVQGEDKYKPYSDSQIVKELEKMGIDISRRTVVKYREQLQIPNALQRKEYR